MWLERVDDSRQHGVGVAERGYMMGEEQEGGEGAGSDRAGEEEKEEEKGEVGE